MKRQPEGVPAGGQFAADRKAEPEGSLSDFAPADNHESRHSDACEITDLDHTPTADCAYPEDLDSGQRPDVTITDVQRASLLESLKAVSEASEDDSNDEHIEALSDALDKATGLLGVGAYDEPVEGESKQTIELRRLLQAADEVSEGGSNDEEIEALGDALVDALGLLGMENEL